MGSHPAAQVFPGALGVSPSEGLASVVGFFGRSLVGVGPKLPALLVMLRRGTHHPHGGQGTSHQVPVRKQDGTLCHREAALQDSGHRACSSGSLHRGKPQRVSGTLLPSLPRPAQGRAGSLSPREGPCALLFQPRSLLEISFARAEGAKPGPRV